MSKGASQMGIVPQFTLDDFMAEKPYEWLYAQKENKFVLQLLLSKVQVLAKQVGFSGFMRTWNAYVESKSPRVKIVGCNQTCFPDQPIQLECGQYVADEYGVSRVNEMGAEVEVISHPILPIKRYCNLDTGTESIEIAYCREGGKWKTLTVSRETLASAQKIIALSKHGVAVNSNNAKDVIAFLDKIEGLNYEQIPVVMCKNQLGWHDSKTFLPYDTSLHLDASIASSFDIYKSIHPAGSLAAWIETVSTIRAREPKNLPARIALAASFASPLIKVLDVLPFWVHLYGGSTTGKTVALKLAASVWGDPRPGGYLRVFDSTANWMEGMAGFLNNLPLILDELQSKSLRKGESLSDYVYKFTNGVSKGRGTKNGGVQQSTNWCSCAITTGEQRITSFDDKGGELARIVDILVRESLFSSLDEPGILLDGIGANYGCAGEEFIKHIINADRAEIQSQFQNIRNRLSNIAAGKQAPSGALLILADQLAEKYIFHDGLALTEDEVSPFLKSADEIDVNLRTFEIVCDWIVTNRSRFCNGAKRTLEGVCYGRIDEGEEHTVYIISEVFKALFQSHGFSLEGFIDWAVAHNVIADYRTPKRKGYNKKFTVNGMNGYPYEFHPYALDDNEGTNQDIMPEQLESSYTVVDDEDLPF